ncbi:MAG: AAA family ATPase [Bifidobacteriaceae bacterium]|nr:AAA family ATPase [Bifidobacteriaceae bacterium]
MLVGPAGAGKTTAMAALKAVWEAGHGTGSVVGLAPSAAAAGVLAGDLGVPCENTARWLAEHDHLGARFASGQLVIVDEASLAGTFTLDRIAAHAAAAGAKVLLAGDWAQLQAVDAGGAFNLLVSDRDGAPELADVHRFANRWERLASLELRHGRPAAVGAYEKRGRVVGGDADQMADAAYAAWREDTQAGLGSVLIAEARQTVTELNQRARADRIGAGEVSPGREAALYDGSAASRGDIVVTRHNDRCLVAGRSGWVRNGDRWTVAKVHGDGAVTVQRAGHRRGAAVVLPATYVAQHLELGYAVTAHRAQGVTADTAHVMVTATTTRENLYVSMTRGRHSNRAYVATDRPDQDHDIPHPADNPEATAASVLHGVLRHSGAEPAAHQARAGEHDRWGSIAQLAAEYETIAAAAQRDRWAGLVRDCGLTAEQAEQTVTSDGFGPLCAELRHAEALGHDPETLLPRLVAARVLDPDADPAEVLHQRLEAAALRPRRTPGGRPRRRLVAGLIPEPAGEIAPDMSQALRQRAALIERRATLLVREAADDGAAWLDGLGPRPSSAAAAARWEQAARTVAAYRDRHGVHTDDPLGPQPASDQPRRDRDRAATSIRVIAAQRAAAGGDPPARSTRPPQRGL